MADLSKKTVTHQMTKMGVDWTGVKTLVTHLTNLLQSEREAAFTIVKTAMAGIAALTSHDVSGVLSAINQETVDVQKVIDAIKAEFGLS